MLNLKKIAAAALAAAMALSLTRLLRRGGVLHRRDLHRQGL